MTRLLAVALAATFVVGCSTPLTTREKGALTGGAIGAGAGAIVGSQVGHTGAGTLIGAGIGAVSGAVIGDAIQGAEQKGAPPPPAPPPPLATTGSPRLVWVPAWGVWVMESHDVVYADGTYYRFHGGRWWVSQAHTGPWATVVTLPAGIAKLPPGQLHARMPTGACPPGQAKKGRC
jgi:hypothetical protein